MIPKLSNKLLLIAILVFVIVLCFHGVPFSFKQSDIGNYIGIAALAIAAWQVQDARENKTEAAITSVYKDLEMAIAKVQEKGDLRDSLQDKQLAVIQQQLVSLLRQSESCENDINRLYPQIFENKDKLAEHGAMLAVIGKQGEIILAIGNIRSEITKLQEK